MPVPPRRGGGLSHSGLVKFSEETYSCEVTNMSATGATLTFKNMMELPDRFTLQLMLWTSPTLRHRLCQGWLR